jgi:glycosyltransferase involved in cell wall biosynthesis
MSQNRMNIKINSTRAIESFNLYLEQSKSAFDKDDYLFYIQCIKKASLEIAAVIDSGEINLALLMEAEWYKFVKLKEDEENYYLSFRGHKESFWRSGELNSPGNPKVGLTNNIAFVAMNSVLLGHTEVMLLIMEKWKFFFPEKNIFFVGMTSCSKDLHERLKVLDIKIITPKDLNLKPKELIEWLRAELEQYKINTAIWLSVPVWVSYIFGYKIAHRQILWSLKFHAVHLGSSVCHIGMTKNKKGLVYINNSPWLAFQPPLIIKNKNKDDFDEIKNIKSFFDGKLIFGTLAREEKFNSNIFIDSIIEILKICPNSVYLFTGHNPSLLLIKKIKIEGLDNRIYHIGWVDTELFAKVIDIFLESFPFGCGITGMQALINGTPLVSLWDSDTLPRFYLEDINEKNKYSPPWFIAETTLEYIGLAKSIYIDFEEGNKPIKFIDNKISMIDTDKALYFYDLVME